MFEGQVGGEPARLRVPSRERVAVGDRVRVEFSFGPLADEVEMRGRVIEIEAQSDGRPPIVIIRLLGTDTDRIQYVLDVLDGERAASARTHRRIPVDFEVRWRWGDAQYASRVRDLSRGGAFIVSRALPAVGSRVDVEIRPPGTSLNFDAVVSWVKGDGDVTGFGVNFKLPDRAMAQRLSHVVREHEQCTPAR